MVECFIWIAIAIILTAISVLGYITYNLFFGKPEIEEEDIWLDLWKEKNDE